jgi:protein-S-isoprenylcysteine O-methyltransferase Ste14
VQKAVRLVVATLGLGVEDRTLRRELDGYTDYAARVHFRLVPGIW